MCPITVLHDNILLVLHVQQYTHMNRLDILLMCIFDEKITRTVTANFRLVSPVFEDNCGVKEQLKDIHEVRTQSQIFIDEVCRKPFG